MTFRVRRSVRIAPGIRLNLGKRGSSLSIGGKGFTETISAHGVRTTVSVPGTGVSYSTSTHHHRPRHRPARRSSGGLGPWIVTLVVLAMLAHWALGGH